MLDDSASKPCSGLRIYILVSVTAFFFAFLYVGWTFYSRWQGNRAIQEKAAEKRRMRDAETFDAMGGNRFDILGFSAYPSIIQAGEKSALCYSVSNAKSVKLEPPGEEPAWPAFTRCVDVSPRKTTKYTLTIEDGAGHSKIATVEVQVR